MQNDSCGFCGSTRPRPTSASCESPSSSRKRADVLFDHVRIEAVVPGGHRRVRGEDAHRGRLAECLVEAQAVLLHPLANEFQRRERRVPFVHVDHARLDAQRLERAGPADAEDDLLADARPLVAAVEPGRQMAIFVLVLRNVGVEQEQRDASRR